MSQKSSDLRLGDFCGCRDMCEGSLVLTGWESRSKPKPIDGLKTDPIDELGSDVSNQLDALQFLVFMVLLQTNGVCHEKPYRPKHEGVKLICRFKYSLTRSYDMLVQRQARCTVNIKRRSLEAFQYHLLVDTLYVCSDDRSKVYNMSRRHAGIGLHCRVEQRSSSVCDPFQIEPNDVGAVLRKPDWAG